MNRIVTDRDRVGAWINKRVALDFHYHDQTIGLERDGELVAGVLYQDYNGANVFMHVASEGAHWLNREFLWFAFYYPFVQMKVKRVTATVKSGNAASLRFVRHLGFTDEFTMVDGAPDGDLEILKMTKANCRWLNIRKPNAIRSLKLVA